MSAINDVAKLAGVSTATVSRVVNDSGNVLPDTAKRVLEAIELLDYRRNQKGRSPRDKKTNLALVVIPGFSNLLWADILEGLDNMAQRYDYSLIVYPTHYIMEKELEAISMLRQKKVDGAVILSTTIPEKKLVELDESYPIIQCCEYNEGTSLSHLSINNYVAAYQATEYFAKLGHRQIAMISANNKFISTTQRMDGYRKALEDYNIPFGDEMIVRGTYSFDSGYDKANILLKRTNRPTAILAISDTVAAGCLCAIRESGLRCPEDVAVIGFDNIAMSRMLSPTLSTVAQRKIPTGETAFSMLMERIGGNKERQQIFMPHELIIRQSA